MIKENCLLESKPKWLPYLIVYLLLLFKAGFYFIELSNIITAPLYLIFLALVMVITKKNIYKSSINNTIVVLAFIILSWIVHGFPNINVLISTIINLITALLLVSLLSKNTFFQLYRDIMFGICCFSIIGWVLIELNGTLIISKLPYLVNTAHRIGWFAGLTFISDFSRAGIQRIQGIFWEPGAMQALTIIAMILEINYGNREKKIQTIKRIIIYTIAIILTFSTTGYVALALVWILILNRSNRNFKFLKSILFILILFLVYTMYSDNTTGFMHYMLVDKIQEILEYSDNSSSKNFSVSTRMDSIVVPLQLLVHDPIFGMGTSGIRKMYEITGHTNTVCTPINYIAYYGMMLGCYFYYGILGLLKDRDSFDKTIIIITLLFSFSSEDFFLNPILSCFMLYGFNSRINTNV